MSTYKTATGKSIDESFSQYMKDNPSIYGYFISYALEWLKNGAKKISAKQIVGRIRWELNVVTKGDEATEFKVNDAYTSRFARRFIEDYPEYSERFNLRELRS